MKIATIGKNAATTLRFTDPRVSDSHAKLTLHDENKIIVEDNQSANGTFVNGLRIVRKEITVNDSLVLVKPTVAEGGIAVNLKQFFAPPPPAALVLKGFEDTLTELESIYKKYKIDKDAIASAHSKKLNLLRGGMIIVPSMISVWCLHDTKYSYYAALVTSGSAALSMMLTSGMTPAAELEKVGEEFMIDYKCKVEGCTRGFFGNISPTVLEANKRCPCTKCTWT
jgi:hypothetical protein